MKPVEQRQLYVPGETTGDCWKCCIASILELPYEAVPHFYDRQEYGDSESAWNDTQTFLRERGLILASMLLWGDERPYLMWGSRQIKYAFHAPGHWIASVVSPRTTPAGVNISHVVVMSGASVAWDPHPLRDEGHLGFTEGFLMVTI